MDRMRLGLLVIVAGLVLGLISALANPLGIGEGGFGWKQILGVIVGAALIVIGAGLGRLTRKPGAYGEDRAGQA